MKKRRQTREVKYSKPNRPEQRRQTKRAGGNLLDKLRAYCETEAHVFHVCLWRLADSPFNSMMTIAVLSIAWSLAAGFQLMVNNLEQLTANLESSSQISLFLKDEVSDARAQKLAETIRQNPDIRQVNVITKEQALAEFKTYSGFGEAVNALKANPLPVVIQIMPKSGSSDKKKLESLVQGFQQLEQVDLAQMDMLWEERLQSIVALAENGFTVLSVILGFAVLFIVGNTIRLELHSRREEVIIARLVGATDSFIQRPFLYSGFWIGLISGVIALFIVALAMLILWHSVETLSALYGGRIHLKFFSFFGVVKLILISSALGVLGSWAVLHFQLRHTVPESA